MTPINWSEEFELGVEEIDEQHRTMVALVNKLYRAIALESSRNQVHGLLCDLIEATQEHFAAEERIMLEAGFPDYGQHKAQHDRLLAELTAFEKEMAARPDPLFHASIRFQEDLRDDWATTHILGPDRKFARFLRKSRT